MLSSYAMEKLIELLNEYETTLPPNEQIEWTEVGVKSTPLIVISKKFKFINWLVENKHIHNIKLLEFIETEPCVVPMFFEEDTQKAKALILMLSIQDNPVDALLTVIK